MKKKWYSLARLALPLIFSLMLFFGILYKSFTLVIVMMISSLLLGAFHCGWLCPFGYLQELAGKLGRKLGLPRLKVPPRIDKFLRYSRYILFALSFLGLGAIYFLGTPYSSVMAFLTGSSGTITLAAGILLGLFLILSLVTDRPFCRYFCIEGARYGALSMGRLFTIRRDREICVDCGACDRACPAGINISAHNSVRNGQCINCFECLAACPRDNALKYGWAFSKSAKEKDNEN